MISEISIVGVGTVGSCLAYLIVLKSLIDKGIKKLYLIDNDYLESKNLPYLFVTNSKSNYLFKPKILALYDMLVDINPNIKIISVYNKFPLNDKELKQIINNTFIIDCRDTSSENSICKMKLNMDGKFGLINLNPINKKAIKSSSRYTIFNSNFYSFSLASICCNKIIFNKNRSSEFKKEKYIINFEKGDIYEYNNM